MRTEKSDSDRAFPSRPAQSDRANPEKPYQPRGNRFDQIYEAMHEAERRALQGRMAKA
jgi:hypothetical protein